MLIMNRQSKLKDGRYVIPYLIQGDIVFSINVKKEMEILKLSDFSLDKKEIKRDNVVVVDGKPPTLKKKIADNKPVNSHVKEEEKKSDSKDKEDVVEKEVEKEEDLYNDLYGF